MSKQKTSKNNETAQLGIYGVSHSNFTFTVSDGFCTYSYPLNISLNNSIDDVVKKIYEAFKLKKENGTLVKP